MVFTATNRAPGFITNAMGFVIVPVQVAMSGTGNWFSNITHYFTGINSLIEENRRLTQEIEENLLNLSRLEVLETENYNLTQLLEMSRRYPQFTVVGADIISRDNNNWNSRFSINRGYSHGIEQNMVLIARGGLVGKINFSANNFSQVTPIIDDTSTVGAVTVRNGITGFIRGDLILGNQGLVRFETEAGADIIEGDEIITSTFGTVFPPGLQIGTIIYIEETGGHGMITAVVEPVADFRNLSAVLIITGVEL